MKKFLAILLIFAMIFSLAACSGKGGETTTAPPPVVEETSNSKEFKNSEGTTVFTVDVAFPQITENCDEKVKAYINNLCVELFDDACEFAESNIENATEFMKSTGSTEPWTKVITFETTLLDNRYACFIVKDAFSLAGGVGTPTWSTKCFDIQTGALCSLVDFTTYPDDPEFGFESFIQDVFKPKFETDFIAPEYITEEVLERLGEIIDSENFFLTENGIGFYFDKVNVDEYLSGMTSLKFTWDELSAYYTLEQ